MLKQFKVAVMQMNNVTELGLGLGVAPGDCAGRVVKNNKNVPYVYICKTTAAEVYNYTNDARYAVIRVMDKKPNYYVYGDLRTYSTTDLFNLMHDKYKEKIPDDGNWLQAFCSLTGVPKNVAEACYSQNTPIPNTPEGNNRLVQYIMTELENG